MATATTTQRRTTGLDLKLRRVAAFVTQGQMAATIGVSRNRITNIESFGHPTPAMVARYLAALDRIASEPDAAATDG